MNKRPHVVAMIPARLGSQRVKKKNLRYLGDKLLVEWVAEACKASNAFDEIYINSEASVFSTIAERCKVNFYQRPVHLATNSATNDEFALDFIRQTPCDILVQVNPTSPFTSAEDIRSIVSALRDGDYHTMHTVKLEQIEGLLEGNPLNFDPVKPMPPSQDLTPVMLFTSSVMGWRTGTFVANMEALGCAVYGGSQKTGFYPIVGDGTVDIDQEKDFFLAECILRARALNSRPRYYED
jgi:CMP-N-acetylneuraminic acid synthetase